MMPFSPGAHGLPSSVTTAASMPGQRDRRRPRLDRQHAEAVRVAEHRAARSRSATCDRSPARGRRESCSAASPRRAVEHFAGTDDALEARVIDREQRLVAVAHQHADRGRRREDAGDAELLDRRTPVGVRRADSRARPRTRSSCSRRAAARRPCSCGRRSSRCPTSPTRRRSASGRSTTCPC